MKMMTDVETKSRKEYQDIWSNPKKINRDGKNLVLGWHLGYYEKGVKSYKEAAINMNNYVGKLLDINNKNLRILDAGCGVGATVIHLAKKYPNSTFFGITLASNEVTCAEKLKRKNDLKNANFFQKSYNATEFPSEYFDSVYSLESACYAEDKQIYLREMSRILKKEGKFVVIDIFKKYNSTNLFIRTIIHKFLKQKDDHRSRDTIDIFKEFLIEEGFKNIEIHNILKTRNVKYFYLYSFLLYSIFNYIYCQLRGEMRQKKHNSLYLTWEFVYRFILTILILIISKYGYYSITAVKK